jgi:hypothetical protein
MSLVWRGLAWVLAISLVVYFVIQASKALDLAVLREALSQSDVWLALLVGSLLYACIIPVTGWAWAILLSARSESWRPSTLAVILGLSQLAKYIPGNIAQHAARATIAMRQGMKPTSLIATVAQETVLAIAASVVIGLLALFIGNHGLTVLDPRQIKIMLIAGILLLTAFGVLLLFNRSMLASQGQGMGRLISALTTLPGWKATSAALLAYSLNYLLVGIGLWCVAFALGESDSLSYLAVTAAFSLSWLLGFMTPGAPAGLGTREGIMLVLLQGTSTSEILVTFVLLARVVTMSGDIISFLGAAFMQTRLKRFEVNR